MHKVLNPFNRLARYIVIVYCLEGHCNCGGKCSSPKYEGANAKRREK
jgi:hypothetical protein